MGVEGDEPGESPKKEFEFSLDCEDGVEGEVGSCVWRVGGVEGPIGGDAMSFVGGVFGAGVVGCGDVDGMSKKDKITDLLNLARKLRDYNTIATIPTFVYVFLLFPRA